MAAPVAKQHPPHQQGTKRKTSATDLPGSGRPVKRRASKACHCCRSRKVRCDVVESGIPCTNCRLDEVECVVTEGKRRKKSYIEGDVFDHSPVESIEDKDEIPQFPIFDDIDALQDVPVPVPTKPVTTDTSNVRPVEYDLNHHRPHLIYQTQGHRLTPEERTLRLSAIGHTPLPSLNSPVRYSQNFSFHSPPAGRPEVVLPQYITPIPKRMLSEDLDYLQRKGAFYIPETGIRNELLRSYVQYVHPYLPLLDLQEFLTAIERNGSGGRVSLLLFQAAIFAATAYIDMRHLTAMGYTSRKSARKAFFQRVKLLYDFDWEIDRVTVVQSVLLMTYWYESPNDPKDVWHWLGIAISIARTIGVNYDTQESTLTLQKRRLWKRIWWSCYMRDRLVAVGMRRPIRIREDDYSVAVLTIDDFETDPLPPELCRMLGGCSAVRDGSKRVTLARMCIAMTQVCQCITHVLSTQYSVMGHKVGITSETTVRLVPRQSGAESSEINKCDEELEQWYSDLPLELRFFMPGTRDRTSNHDGEVIGLHRALLTGIYLTATSALHRPQMMPVTAGIVIEPELKDLSKRRVREAAMDITEIFRDLYAHDLVRYLPNTGVTVILPAIIIHLLDIKSKEAVDRQASMRHFQFCMQALQKLRDVYSSADFAFSFLDAATRKADIPSSSLPQTHLKSDASPSTKSNSRSPSSKKSLTLTPPPDLQDSQNKTSNGGARNTSHIRTKMSRPVALTPPTSYTGHNATFTGGAAVSLKDLESAIDIDGMAGNGLEMYPAFSLNTTNMSMSPINVHRAVASPTSYGPLHVRSNSSNSALMNDFDQLINLEGGTELFAPTKVTIDDNLFKDIDMEWLADPEPNMGVHDDQVQVMSGTHFDDTKQLETPDSSDFPLKTTLKKTISSETADEERERKLANSGYAEVGAETQTNDDDDNDDNEQRQRQSQLETDQMFEGYTISGDLDLELTVDDEFE